MKEILSDLKWVLLKIVIVAGSLAVIFTWILGICRCKDDQMNPSFQPGDLILYSGHVAIYLGNNQIVHASNPRYGITTGTATYRNIVAIRRIFN